MTGICAAFCAGAITTCLLCSVAISLVCADCPEYERQRALLELANTGSSKDLICNVKNPNCQVSWDKDGSPLTSEGDRHYTDCHGQQLVITTVTAEDAGNYTCLAYDTDDCRDESQLPQWVQLKVYPGTQPVPPFHIPSTDCRDTGASVGDNVTFCCLFHVGDLPAGNVAETYWSKGEGDNRTWNFLPGPSASDYIRFDNKTIGSCHAVQVINKTYFDNYTVYCNTGIGDIINSTIQLYKEIPLNADWPAWLTAVVSAISAVSMATVLAGIVYWRNKVDIQLLLKDRLGKQENGDGKQYDAYISYYWSDSESAPSLDRRYALDLHDRLTRQGYRVCLPELDFVPGSTVSEEISTSLQQSRRYIILLSPEFITYRYMLYETEQGLDILEQSKKQIIPLFLRSIPSDVIQQHTVLDHIVKSHPRLNWQIFEQRPLPINGVNGINGEAHRQAQDSGQTQPGQDSNSLQTGSDRNSVQTSSTQDSEHIRATEESVQAQNEQFSVQTHLSIVRSQSCQVFGEAKELLQRSVRSNSVQIESMQMRPVQETVQGSAQRQQVQGLVQTQSVQDAASDATNMNGRPNSNINGCNSATESSAIKLKKAEMKVWKKLLLQMPPRPKREVCNSPAGDYMSESDTEKLAQSDHCEFSRPEV